MTTTTSPVRRIEFQVSGMHCASCAQRVQKTLAEADGVRVAGVNLALERATVEAEPEVDEAALVDAVAALGYTLVPAHEGAPTHDGGGDSEGTGKGRVIVAALLTAPVVLLSMLGVTDTWALWLQGALITPVELWAGLPFLQSAYRGARHRRVNMDTLIALGTLAAYLYSLWSLLYGGHLYFETAGVIITFLLLGRFLEHCSKSRAASALQRPARACPDPSLRCAGGPRARRSAGGGRGGGPHAGAARREDPDGRSGRGGREQHR